MRSLSLFLLLLLSALGAELKAQIDVLHYIPPFFARENVINHYIIISTLDTDPVSVTVRDGAGTVVLTTTVTYLAPQTIQLGNNYNSPGILNEAELNTVTTEGLIVEATAPVFVNMRHMHSAQGMSLTSKGAATAPGTDFRTGHIHTNGNYLHVKAHSISFMALEDNTTINVSDISPGVIFRNTPVTGNTSNNITVTLNAFESYTIATFANEPGATGNINDVNGTRITSDKNIVVNTGSWLSGAAGNGRDIGADQLVPVDLLGDEYIFVEGNGNNQTERPLVVATQDNTDVFVNGNPTPVANLNAGDYIFLPQSSYTANDNIHIRTSQVVYMYQSLSGANTASTSLNFIPPLRCSGSRLVMIPSVDLIGAAEVSITARTGAWVTINGAPVGVAGLPVTGNANWVTYTVPGGTGHVYVESDSVINVALLNTYGVRGGAGYFSGFARFNEVDRGDTTDFVICKNVTETFIKYSLESPYYEVSFDYMSGVHGLLEEVSQSNDTLFVRYTRPSPDFVGNDSIRITVCKSLACGGAIPDTLCESSVLIFANQTIITSGADSVSSVCASLTNMSLDSLLSLDATPGGIWHDLDNSGALFGNSFQPAVAGAGTWRLAYVVDDGFLCQDSSILSITVLPMDDAQCCYFNPSIDFQNVLCNGGTSGFVQVNDVYANRFSLNGGNFTGNSQFQNLSAGTYTIISNYGAVCYDTTQVVITEPTALSASTIINQAILCYDDCNGGMTFSAAGGVAPYTYELNSLPIQNTGVFNNLCAGNYRLDIRDSNACLLTIDTVLTEPTPVSIVVDSTIDITCGIDNGAIYLSASGGSGNYQYSINNPTPTPFTLNNGDFTNLAAGTYTLYVQDANLCVDSVVVTLTATTPATIQINNVQNNDCFGVPSGRVILSTQNGSAPFQYSLDGVNFQNTNMFNNLAAGNYWGYSIDRNNCIDSTQFTIGEPAPISFSSGPFSTPPTCNGDCDATVTVNVTGGTGNYSININGVQDNNFTSTTTLNNLCAGANQQIQVTDRNGCLLTSFITITEPAPLDLGATPTDESCAGACDGSVIFNSTGGTGAHQYSFDFGNTWSVINSYGSLCQQAFNVQVRDANLCAASDTFSIQGPEAFTIRIDSVENANCGIFSGEIGVTVVGGDFAPYTLSINPVPQSVNNVTAHNFTALAPNIYTITAVDQSGCTVSQTAGVSDNTLNLGLNIIVRDVACFGDSSGQVQVNGANGLAPYTYAIDDPTAFGANNIFGNLPKGTFTFAVRDANGCIATAQATVNEPDLLQTASSVVDLNCFEVCNGQVQFVNMSGGIRPYAFSVDNGANYQTDSLFTNLCAGNYNLAIRDANNCVTNWYQEVDQANEILLNFTYDSISCNGGSDAFVLFQAQGGTGALNYSIDNCASNQASPFFNNLSANTYTLCIEDANLCRVDSVITINEPSALNLALSGAVTNLNCFESCDGAFTANLTGGVSPYLYSLDSIQFLSNNSFTQLCEGNYTIYAVDDNDCPIDLAGQMVTQPTELLITAVNVVNSTCGNNNASVTLTAGGGTGALTYVMNGMSNGNNNVFNNLLAGTYTFGVRDVNNCAFDTVITVGNEPEPQIDLVLSTNPLCAASTDGYFILTASSGALPYSYSIDGVNYQANDTLMNVGAGTYTVYVRDNNLCVASQSVTMNAPQSLGIQSLNVTNIDCFGDSTGVIDLTASGGTAAYSYSIDNGANYSFNNTFSNLGSGTYNIIIQDANGCVSATSVANVTQQPQMIFNQFVIDSTSCYGICNGQVAVQVTGGAPSGVYQYQWTSNANAGVNDNTATNLCAGNYSLIVTDDLGCTLDSVNFALGEPDQAVFTGAPVGTLPLCSGDATGSITVNSLNGAFFSIDGGALQAANVFNSLDSGFYDLQVFDANGCRGATVNDFYLGDPSPLQAFVTPGEEVCPNTAVDIYAAVAGGTAPYTFDWNNGAYTTDAFTVNITADATFNLTVTDAHNCSVGPITTTYTLPPALVNVMDDNRLICPGDTIRVNSNVSGGVDDYSWNWSNGDTTAYTSDSITGNTVLTVLITDQCGTSMTDSVVVNTYDLPRPIVAITPNSGCAPVAIELVNQAPATNQDSLVWYVDGLMQAGNDSAIIINLSGAGCHDIRIESYSVQGCRFDTTMASFVCVGEAPVAGFTYNPNPIVSYDPTVQFNNTTAGGDQYVWTFENNSTSTIEHPSFTFQEDGSTSYNVCLEAINNQFGCRDTLCRDLPIDDVALVYIPNTFTPNENRKNETFYPVFSANEVESYSFRIYDRWGTEVFRSDVLEEGWEGTGYKSGAYVWVLDYKIFDDDIPKTMKGHVLLLR